MEDHQIIDLYHQRDPAAIHETDQKYGGLCRRIAYGILSSPEDTEECVSDTYMAAWSRMPPQRPGNLRCYLSRIVRNISISRLRKRYSRKNGGGELPLVLEELGEIVTSRNDMEEQYAQKELAMQINAFLHMISHSDRTIFLLRYWGLLPVSEIAQKCGYTESKVKTSLFRTRKKLSDHLKKEGFL